VKSEVIFVDQVLYSGTEKVISKEQHRVKSLLIQASFFISLASIEYYEYALINELPQLTTERTYCKPFNK
jgi:hypothetical protein